MKHLKLLLSCAVLATFFTSCYVEETKPIVEPTISLNQLLNSYDLWYVDINATQGYGETPFLQIAFSISFDNGLMYANNNLVGFGNQGNGFGVEIGDYNSYNMVLEVNHVVDGFDQFEVFQIDNNTIELYNSYNDTSYFLNGYQRSDFDYDVLFYDNIHYFLQEYDAWEKTYTSNYGLLKDFDNENYIQFLSGGNDDIFRSSQDTNINNVFWDYTGSYGVENVSGNMYLKTLTLDYDFFDNETFELSVINDSKIALLHEQSGTVYEFTGRGYIPYYRNSDTSNKEAKEVDEFKKRERKTKKVENERTPKLTV
ncbi:nicotinic acid mononucleotide adenyltransferase [Winogradskyella bathintestinalis]|uniref:Nicotinic acid mononucleotide adenyltransferase n=1 Tax=Winogradskyella bathintestinalis TaxID=3035208 RepID=A0ABT7ZQT9_9FLAO|nr:nicotinic acid mononucleotide adenyltransferase [Winogradskyella bathintestinalis]MDN3491367.1 nicotinic acid mononucleotide adenyltransferase [Winogradskyella bathintestinalis]